MGCEECEKVQEMGQVAYYRWNNANIAMSGCNQHLREMFDALNVFQTMQREAERMQREKKEKEAKKQ